jgi:hypothetical protein
MQYNFKINGLIRDAEFNRLPFGRRIDHNPAILAFKAGAQHIHYSAKGKSTRAGFRDFKALYQPTQWFYVDYDTPSYHDDSFEVWFVK